MELQHSSEKYQEFKDSQNNYKKFPNSSTIKKQ